jgi:hypothetical protein
MTAMKQLCLCLLLLAGLAAQAQEIEKETVYTLGEGEVLATNESNLHLYLSKMGYVAVIDNQLQKNRKYIINRGIYGPFERRSIAPPTLTDKHWCFTDTQKDSNVVIFDGYKVYKHPSSQRTFDARITDYLQSYIMYNERLSEYNIQVNGRSQGPFPNLIDYYLSNYGDSWAVVFFENDGNRYEYYVQFSNGNLLGPFEQIYQFVFLDINQWILMAKKFNTEPIVASGIDEASMQETEELVERYSIITNKGDLGLFERKLVGDYDYEQYNRVAYTTHNYAVNVIKDQKIYYLVNGQLFGPYEDFVKQYDLGIKPDRFNYVVGADQTLYFRGRKGFSSNVQYFKVSDSRNSVAIVKPNPDTGKDSLVINEKYYVGEFYSILDIKFIPNTEDFYFWSFSETAFDTYQLNAYVDGQVEYMGEYSLIIDVLTGYPTVYFTPSKKHWAFIYQDLNTQEYKMVIDGIEYPAGILPKVVVYKDNDGFEYAAWLDLDGNKLVLNKLKFQD